VTESGASRAVTADRLGAWVVKANPALASVATLAGDGFAGVARWCVRPSYRTGLVAAGQPVLLWVSGKDPGFPAGFHAFGEVTGPCRVDAGQPEIPMRLRPMPSPALRAELLLDPVLATAEVVRMPAGSNPSYLDREQYAALRAAYLPALGNA
jgi:hypothetical protein